MSRPKMPRFKQGAKASGRVGLQHAPGPPKPLVLPLMNGKLIRTWPPAPGVHEVMKTPRK